MAVATNDGKMPVLVAGYSYEDNTHKLVNSKEEINSFYLADIISVGDLYFSIGDILIVCGCVGTFALVFNQSIKYYREKRQEIK